MSNKNNTYWKVSCLLTCILSVISFSPLVIPYGQHKPYLFSLPYTLWVGILVTILFVLLTYVGAKVHPAQDEEAER